jgi:hypothetical protein
LFDAEHGLVLLVLLLLVVVVPLLRLAACCVQPLKHVPALVTWCKEERGSSVP